MATTMLADSSANRWCGSLRLHSWLRVPDFELHALLGTHLDEACFQNVSDF